MYNSEPYIIQLVLGVKNAHIIACEIEGSSLNKKAGGPQSILFHDIKSNKSKLI